jgi:hypothetical protein
MRCPSLTLLICAATLSTAVGCGDSSSDRGPRANREVVQNLRARNQGDSSTAQSGGSSMDQADGWGTIRGRFVYGGQAPAQPPLSVTKDLQFCGQHRVLDESLVIGPDGGVKNVVVFLRTRDPKVHESYAEKIKQPVVFDNRNCRFEPHVLLVHTAQPVEILNSDPVGHNTSVQFQRNPSFSQGVASNERVMQKMDVAETLPAPAACNVHPWMGGWIVVKDNPYMAVTDENGNFVIENVPAGVELEFQVWHERGAGNQGAVDGTGSVSNVDRGRIKVTVPKDGEVDLKDITLPPSSFRS